MKRLRKDDVISRNTKRQHIENGITLCDLLPEILVNEIGDRAGAASRLALSWTCKHFHTLFPPDADEDDALAKGIFDLYWDEHCLFSGSFCTWLFSTGRSIVLALLDSEKGNIVLASIKFEVVCKQFVCELAQNQRSLSDVIHWLPVFVEKTHHDTPPDILLLYLASLVAKEDIDDRERVERATRLESRMRSISNVLAKVYSRRTKSIGNLLDEWEDVLKSQPWARDEKDMVYTISAVIYSVKADYIPTHILDYNHDMFDLDDDSDFEGGLVPDHDHDRIGCGYE